MQMSFRWFGEEDPITLEQIRQIPGVTGVVSAVYDVPAGEVWPYEKIVALKRRIEEKGLTLSAIESVPVHEDIKLGRPSRERYIENFRKTLRNLARAGVTVVCYNFMPVFDWTRTDLTYRLPDGSSALAYDEETAHKMDPGCGELELPGWDTSYDKSELRALLEAYRGVTEDDLWEHLRYFLVKVMETADDLGINMAIHPDDPPWSIFGLPRIITSRESLERLIGLVDSPRNGLTFCTGSLGADPGNDLPAMIRYFGGKGRIHFAHVRNIKITGNRSFVETAHRSSDGSVDMYEVMKAFWDVGFDGPMRPDHGRMIWGETGRPGYGLYDRALGAVYLNGIWEALQKSSGGLRNDSVSR